MSELTLVHSSVSLKFRCLGLLTSVLVIHWFVASCKSQLCRLTKILPTRPRVYLVFIPMVSHPNMSSFGYKNRYYTWTSHSPPSKDWVEKRSKKIKIKIVSKSQKTVTTNVNQIPGTSWLSERVARTHPRLANPHEISVHYNLKTLQATNAKSGFILFTLAFIKGCRESQSRCMSAVFKTLIYTLTFFI